MKNLKKIYAITSILFLLVLAVSPLKNYFQEWRSIQNKFNNSLENYPQKIKPVSIGLKQIWIKDLNRIDRCTSCHISITESKLTNADEPFKTHPRIFHDIEKFGCTICHQGQGLATNYKDVHKISEFWEEPLLPNKYIESSCGRCHVDQNLSETPNLNSGRKLIKEFNCIGCHDISGIKKTFVPILDGIGSKVTGRQWLVYWLTSPTKVLPKAKMPDFLLSKDEANILADFLMSFKSFTANAQLDSLPQIYIQKKNKEDFISLGQTKFREARCISCHLIEGKGGHLAVDLIKVASKSTETWIYNYLRNPKKFQPGVEMPQYGFSNEEAAAITAYMKSEFVDLDMPENDQVGYRRHANFFEKGLMLFNKYNCSGCHQLSAKGIVGNRGPELNLIGSKNLFQIEWGTSSIPHTVYNFIENKISDPRIFGEQTRMPVYNLTDSGIEAITTYLLSLKKVDFPIKYFQTSSPSTLYFPLGDVGKIFNKYSCLKCHSLKGNGGDIAPDLTIVGSQLQSNWIKQYFKVPYSLRPIVEERMPKLFITDQEIEILINYFNTELLDDSISISENLELKNSDADRGKNLYSQKYGCQSCHILNGKGGYVGPPLDNVGNRLKPGWIYNWLKNPQKYKPETIEPRAGMSDKDAMDITSYLMSLKKEK